MTKKRNNVDTAIKCYNELTDIILDRFCKKQGFTEFGFAIGSDDKVVFFDNDLMMLFTDIVFDLIFNIEEGIAVKYMCGFDMSLDNAQIEKELNYKEYLESKKLIKK
jgi:hypothetical protein